MEEVLLQNSREESLRKVFSILNIVAPSSQVHVQGIPVRLAQRGECLPGLLR